MHGELQVNILKPAEDTDLKVTGNLKVENRIEAADITINGKSLEEILALATPIGSIIPFGGDISKIDTGWILCDGTLYPIAGEYDRLYQIIGRGWGGNEDYFRVPDLTGRFLRGVSKDHLNNDVVTDPDRNERFKFTEDDIYGNIGNNVGTYQNDDFKSHSHRIRPHANSGAGGVSWQGSHSPRPYNDSSEETGGNQTHPKNAAVNYIIKYR